MNNNTLVETALDDRGVATITLNRPDKHNALDADTIRALHAALLEVQDNASVRVVVLTGNGASFCAGADIAHMRSMQHASEQQNIDDALLLARCLRTLDELQRPVIARINGNVFGGGIGLVCCADIAIAAQAAKFALTEVRLGIVPAVISPYVVAATGPRQARRLFLTAVALDAAQARELQLLHFVTPPELLDSTVAEQVELLLRAGPHATRAAKQLIRHVHREHEPDALNHETASLLAQLRTSPEGQEGLSAFLEKRRPSWHA
jgi:methylglutaconyl-CoA hydratase